MLTVIDKLVGGDWNHGILWLSIGNLVTPTDELIFFRGVGQPPASYSWTGCKQATFNFFLITNSDGFSHGLTIEKLQFKKTSPSLDNL